MTWTVRDLTGQRCGELTIIERAPNQGRDAAWRCRCSCGNEKVIRSRSITTGNAKSCGHLRDPAPWSSITSVDGKCGMPGCDRPARTKGMCQGHHLRWLRHGDPLAGGTSPGAALAFLEKALAYDGNECLIWPHARSNGSDDGYAHVSIDGKIQVASRVVCERVNGPPPTSSHQAAHSCGKGDDGCVTPKHLRWATRKDNEADKIAHGTRGQKHG